MPAIDLARLRKQANRLADFFFLADDFMKHLHELLESYVNHTLKTKENFAPGSVLKTYRTPPVVLRQIEIALRELSTQSPEHTLELADALWDENALETCLLAAYLLGRIPPQEERLLPRLTAWAQQVRDANVHAVLLSTSLARMRKETPQNFFALVSEWLHPERTRMWSLGLQALIPMLEDTSFENFPPILALVEPVIQAASAELQPEIEQIIIRLYKSSSAETTYMLKQILAESENPMTAITMRRIEPSLPKQLQFELKDILRAKPFITKV